VHWVDALNKADMINSVKVLKYGSWANKRGEGFVFPLVSLACLFKPLLIIFNLFTPTYSVIQYSNPRNIFVVSHIFWTRKKNNFPQKELNLY